MKADNFKQALSFVFTIFAALVLTRATFEAINDSFAVKSIFAEEHWLTIHQIKLFLREGLEADIRLARIPSIFPDYFTSAAAILLGNRAESVMIYCIGITSFIIGITQVLLASVLSAAPVFISAAIYAGIVFLISLQGHSYLNELLGWNLTASLPLHHGGALITTTLFGILAAKHLGHSEPSKELGTAPKRIGALAVISILSSKLSILTWIAPAILIDLFNSKAKIIFSLKNLWTCLVISTCIGLASYRILPVQPASDLRFSIDILNQNISRHIHIGPETTGIGLFIMASLLALQAIKILIKRETTSPQNKTGQSLANLLQLGILLNLIAYPFAATDKWSSPKYALASFLLAPGIATGLLAKLLNIALEQEKERNRIHLNLAKRSPQAISLLLLASLGITLTVNTTFNSASKAQLLLEHHSPDGLELLHFAKNKYGLVVIDGLNDLGLQAKSNWHYDLYPLSSNGLTPIEWSKSKSELLIKPNSEKLKPYSFILFKNGELEKISSTIPISLDFSAINCDQTETCILEVTPGSLDPLLSPHVQK